MKNTFIEIINCYENNNVSFYLNDIENINTNKEEDKLKIKIYFKEKKENRVINFYLNNNLGKKTLSNILSGEFENIKISYEFNGTAITINDKITEIDNTDNELYNFLNSLSEDEKNIIKDIDNGNIKIYNLKKNLFQYNREIILNLFYTHEVFEEYKNKILNSNEFIEFKDFVFEKFNDRFIEISDFCCLDIDDIGIKDFFDKCKNFLNKYTDIMNSNIIYYVIKVYKNFLKYKAKEFLLEKVKELNIDITNDNIIYYLEEIDKAEYPEIRIYTNDILQDEIWSIENDKMDSVIIDEDVLYEIYHEIKEM